MHVISTSYGNDSIATIRWAHENNLQNVTAAYIHTGWASADWFDRVERGEALAKRYGFKTVQIMPKVLFPELMRIKKGFPNQRFQWCSGALKGVPFLEWIDEVDKDRSATVIIGKRREESAARAATPEFIEASEYHGDRRVWHPLYRHSEFERNTLIARTGFEILKHRSHECHPCVNANRGDFITLTQEDIGRVKRLEDEVGKTMFRPARHKGAIGIVEVHKWACSGNYVKDQDDLFDVGCGSPFGCGL